MTFKRNLSGNKGWGGCFTGCLVFIFITAGTLYFSPNFLTYFLLRGVSTHYPHVNIIPQEEPIKLSGNLSSDFEEFYPGNNTVIKLPLKRMRVNDVMDLVVSFNPFGITEESGEESLIIVIPFLPFNADSLVDFLESRNQISKSKKTKRKIKRNDKVLAYAREKLKKYTPYSFFETLLKTTPDNFSFFDSAENCLILISSIFLKIPVPVEKIIPYDFSNTKGFILSGNDETELAYVTGKKEFGVLIVSSKNKFSINSEDFSGMVDSFRKVDKVDIAKIDKKYKESYEKGDLNKTCIHLYEKILNVSVKESGKIYRDMFDISLKLKDKKLALEILNFCNKRQKNIYLTSKDIEEMNKQFKDKK